MNIDIIDIKAMLFVALMMILTVPTISVQADEPTWLFTVPKAESLEEGYYHVGFVYADFGIAENLELGIHGLKYSVPASSLAFGLSIVPMGSPYFVSSLDISPGKLHLGIKAAPYIFFAGFETAISDKVKFVAELNNGVSAGVRIFPAQNWTLDVFAAFISFEVYKYRIEIEDFHSIPGILFAYSGRL
jgi:hypothetical protein